MDPTHLSLQPGDVLRRGVHGHLVLLPRGDHHGHRGLQVEVVLAAEVQAAADGGRLLAGRGGGDA